MIALMPSSDILGSIGDADSDIFQTNALSFHLLSSTAKYAAAHFDYAGGGFFGLFGCH
jgi:hypothetical protein